MINSLHKKLSLSYLTLLSAEFIYNFSAYIIAAGIARMLGPEGQGRYAVVIGMVTMFTILVARGFPTAMMKRISEDPENVSHVAAVRKATLTLHVPLVCGATILFFLFCPLIARLLGDPSLVPLLRIGTLIIPLFSLSTFYVLYLNGLKSFRALAIIKSLRGLTRIFSILLLAYFFHLPGAIWGNVFAPLLLFVLAVFVSTFFDPMTRRVAALKAIPSYPLKSILSFAGGFMVYLFCYELFMRLDLFLLKALLADDAITGYYDAAVKVALLPFYGVYALTLILFPTLSEMAARKDFSAIRSLLNTLALIGLVTLPIGTFILYVARDFFVQIIFGSEFAYASEILPYMLGASIFATIFYVLASVLNGAGYTRSMWVIISAGLTLSLILNYIFIPLYAEIATAAIFSLTTLLMALSTIAVSYWTFYRVRS